MTKRLVARVTRCRWADAHAFVLALPLFASLIPSSTPSAADERVWIRLGVGATSREIAQLKGEGISPALSGIAPEFDVGIEIGSRMRFGAGVLGLLPESVGPEIGAVSGYGSAEYLRPFGTGWRLGGTLGLGWLWFLGDGSLLSELEQSSGSGGSLVPDERTVRASAPMVRGEFFVSRQFAGWFGVRLCVGYRYSDIAELKDSNGSPIITQGGSTIGADMSSWLVTLSFDMSTEIRENARLGSQ